MLNKWVQDLIKKYSFIQTTILRGSTLFIYYKKEGKLKNKRLPFRATKEQVLACMERIKEDINYYEDKKERDKKVIKLTKPRPEGFAVSF